MSSASEPTIQDLLARFLAAQRARLAARTYRNYGYVVELLSHCLNGYAYQDLNEVDRKRWEKAFDAGDEDAFCRIFGAGHIVENLGEFLGYFMVRKVIAGQELIAAAGTVTKKLARWLHDQDLRPARPRLRAVDHRAQDDRCPACGELMIDAEQEPQSPHAWEQWFIDARRTLRKQRVAQRAEAPEGGRTLLPARSCSLPPVPDREGSKSAINLSSTVQDALEACLSRVR